MDKALDLALFTAIHLITASLCRVVTELEGPNG